MNIICKVIGHTWKYRDYSEWILDNGKPYPFLVARKCTFCSRHEYYYTGWVHAEKNQKLDVQRDGEEKKEIPHVLKSNELIKKRNLEVAV
ncbi:MAG: hypothetical protein ABI723_25715 [Bacteroidia bacterium]